MTRRSLSNQKASSEQLGFDMGMSLPQQLDHQEGPALLEKKHSESNESAQVTGKSDSPETSKVLSVGELTDRITTLLEEGIGMIWVEGEISNFRRQSSGHAYFTLKDEEAQLSCVLFARTAATQGRVELRDGMQVQLYGQISVYQPRGQYQLMVRLVQSKGEGALRARFEELKLRLAAEGLFEQGRKRAMPRFPRRIGVVTSPTGAAIHDFLRVLHRRHPGLCVVISPVRVQGKGAASEIAAAIAELSSQSVEVGPVDVIVVTRGGGSLEDLWEFNEEVVARAIAASSVPVVSAVGHEIDFSIADFVADLRAPTPSAAAELLAADGAELLQRFTSHVALIASKTKNSLERHQAQFRLLFSSSLFREPLRRVDEYRQLSDSLEDTLSQLAQRKMEQLHANLSNASVALKGCHPGVQLARVNQLALTLGAQLHTLTSHRLDLERGRFSRLQTALSALSPEATLARGFSITRNQQGKVVTDAAEVQPGERLTVRLARGEIRSEVVER